MLAFVDLETTGLSAEKHEVLEVACIVTTDMFEEVARFERLVRTSTRFYELDEFIRDMHTKNGLWSKIQESPLYIEGPIYIDHLVNVDDELAKFLRFHAVTIAKKTEGDKITTTISRPQLAGNTISFDRAFMKRHLPMSEAELHYRNIDLSSLNEMARRFWPGVHKARPASPEIAHRAMADAEDSLRLARYYSTALVPTGTMPLH